jgi:HSP20 family protein
MLMRTDPLRELDRLSQQLMGNVGTQARPAAMPMDAWREGEEFVVEFDLPGVDPQSVDLDVERNVLTVKAERPSLIRLPSGAGSRPSRPLPCM